MQAAAAASQVTGALQLAALLVFVGSSRETDAYITLFSASQLTGSVLVMGTLQPYALSQPNYAGWRRWGLVGVVTNTVIVVLVAGYLNFLDYSTNEVWVTAALIACSGAVAVVNGVASVRRALAGAPALLAGLTVIPNVAATLGVAVPSGYRVELMCAGLLVGNLVVLGWLQRRDSQTPLRAVAEVDRGAPPRRDIAGLLAASSVGALGPFGLQAATAAFPAGQATLIGVVSRLAAGVVGIGVTAYTYSVTDWERRDQQPLHRLSMVATIASAFAALAAALTVFMDASTLAQASVAGILWTCAAASQASVQRVLGLKGRYRVFRLLGAATLVLYPLGTLTLIFVAPNAAAYFAVLALIAALANAAFCFAAGWRDVGRAAVPSLVAAAIVLGAQIA